MFPLRVSLSTSKVSPIDASQRGCIDISGPPESSLMKPKPRSGGSAITASWIAASIVSGLSSGFFRPFPPEVEGVFVVVHESDCFSHAPPERAHLQIGFPPGDRTPSHDGSPRVSRRWASDVFPRSWKLSRVSSEISRTSPTISRPAASNTVRTRAGSSTSLIGVSSGSSGLGSSNFGSLTSSSLQIGS
jgi:hypothetical protein